MKFCNLYALTLAPLTFAAATSESRCREVTFSVSGSAQNLNITGITSLFSNATALTAVLQANDFPSIPVSGAQQLAGWYCKPYSTNVNSDKLQLFFGSITTNRESWTAQGGTGLTNPPNTPYKPQMYSWVEYANRKGYPTLAMDLLGQGRSSHPDPVLVVQAFYESALYHDLVTQLKSGSTGQISSAYKTIYLVGNSYGSEIGNLMAQNYPNDFAAMVLTGWSGAVIIDLPGILLLTPTPAAIVDPARFGTLDPAYVTSPVEASRTNSFFGEHNVVDFEQTVADLFFQRKDVVSLGQFVSIYVITQPAPAYKGRVLVLTGENDQAFCGLGSSAISPDTMCGPLLPAAAALFPNADSNYQSIPRSGHALILHQTSQQTFQVAHEFFAGAKFSS